MAGVSVVAAAFGGTVLRLAVAPGEPVRDGALLMVIESMKMEHAIEAPATGTVESFSVSVGDAVQQGDALLTFAPSADAPGWPDKYPPRQCSPARAAPWP